jgi:ElaB/YqjD/DUF883 family membrane-anchored ribosome-binding protein
LAQPRNPAFVGTFSKGEAMATKAQLMAELELLRQQMADRDKNARSESPNTAIDALGDDQTDGQSNDPKAHLNELLQAQGISKDEIDVLWAQLTDELADLTREKPMLTVATALGLGFVLGRMSK